MPAATRSRSTSCSTRRRARSGPGRPGRRAGRRARRPGDLRQAVVQQPAVLGRADQGREEPTTRASDGSRRRSRPCARAGRAERSPFPYTLRQSARSRHLRITIDPELGPRRHAFRRRPGAAGPTREPRIDAFLGDRGPWIQRHLDRRARRAGRARGPRRARRRGDGPVPRRAPPAAREPGRPRGRSTVVADRDAGRVRAAGLARRRATRPRSRRSSSAGSASRPGSRSTPRSPITRPPSACGRSAISLRDPRSRWGSASRQGRLMFSWRLILAPPEALETVVDPRARPSPGLRPRAAVLGGGRVAPAGSPRSGGAGCGRTRWSCTRRSRRRRPTRRRRPRSDASVAATAPLAAEDLVDDLVDGRVVDLDDLVRDGHPERRPRQQQRGQPARRERRRDGPCPRGSARPASRRGIEPDDPAGIAEDRPQPGIVDDGSGRRDHRRCAGGRSPRRRRPARRDAGRARRLGCEERRPGLARSSPVTRASLSSSGQPRASARARPTVDLPDPIIPTSTIRAGGGELVTRPFWEPPRQRVRRRCQDGSAAPAVAATRRSSTSPSIAASRAPRSVDRRTAEGWIVTRTSGARSDSIGRP